MSAVLDAALDYAFNRGLRVIALSGKQPNGRVHPHGLKDALSAAEPATAFDAAFAHASTTGVGILTGMPYYVVDIDGEEGARAWMEMVGEEEFIPDRWVARTGRGLHLWVGSAYRFPTARLADKLDFKGEGGYVAAPPSRHPDGHEYEWLLPPSPVLPPLEMPLSLERLLLRRQREQEAKMVSRRAVRLQARRPLEDGVLYAVATFGGIIDRVRAEPEGNRNAVLYWAARTMVEEGADDEDLEELLNAAIESGLQRRESRLTIRSAVRATGG